MDPLILKEEKFCYFETPEKTTRVTQHLIPEHWLVSLVLLHSDS